MRVGTQGKAESELAAQPIFEACENMSVSEAALAKGAMTEAQARELEEAVWSCWRFQQRRQQTATSPEMQEMLNELLPSLAKKNGDCALEPSQYAYYNAGAAMLFVGLIGVAVWFSDRMVPHLRHRAAVGIARQALLTCGISLCSF